jgi:diacylglycerol kinase family enzyme
VIVNGGRYFLNASGTGIDIQVLKCAVPLKRFFGSAAYFISLAKTAFTYKATEMTLTVDGVSETDKYLLLAVCNGGYIGGKLNIAPPASINDGLITLCKIKSMPRLKLMAMFPLVKWGRHRILKEVSFVNCSSVKLEFKGRRTIHFDGNLFDFESPLTFEIVKNAVKLIV